MKKRGGPARRQCRAAAPPPRLEILFFLGRAGIAAGPPGWLPRGLEDWWPRGRIGTLCDRGRQRGSRRGRIFVRPGFWEAARQLDRTAALPPNPPQPSCWLVLSGLGPAADRRPEDAEFGVGNILK
ncbi:hypothetical protein NDU88_005208 [Pleurodeles waltl]|uniref:Uncharacterized protein n=1 Tax=Pleurodeles waltl TaxID=8319 RepID=A0AAV7NPK5_PLEWA|nr:hypothetical protein NDU88_005208 [Pleurodeles waltl]